LGNSNQKVRQILISSKRFKPEHIEAVMEEIEHKQKKTHQKRSVKLLLVLGAVIFACVIAFAFIFFQTQNFLNTNKEAGQYYHTVATDIAQQKTDNPAIGLGGVQTTQVAPGVSVFNVPSPVVETLASGKTQPTSQTSNLYGNQGHKGVKVVCPINSEAAASIFGGSKENWRQQNGQWILLDNNGASVYIPDGMSGGYLIVGSGIEMKSVLGPAQVSNIYMIVITCDS
jgi:hypothetical protein